MPWAQKADVLTGPESIRKKVGKNKNHTENNLDHSRTISAAETHRSTERTRPRGITMNSKHSLPVTQTV